MTVGSLAIASWIAHGVLVVLLLRAWIELRPRTAIVFALLWLAGYLVSPYVVQARLLFMPYVAMLDIALLLRLAWQGRVSLGLRIDR